MLDTLINEILDDLNDPNFSLSTCSQIELEQLYSKYQLHDCIANEFYENEFEQVLTEAEIPVQFGIDLMVQIYLHKRADVPTLVGLLKRHFEDEERPAQACADMLLKAIDSDLVDYHEMTGKVVVKYHIDKSIQDRIDQFMYPMPMIEKPSEIRSNRQSGYKTIFKSLILKKNHHDDDICLDHVNRLNGINLKLNENVVAFIQNKWRNLDKPKKGETIEDFQKRRKAFHKYDRTSREVLAALMAQGNEFWITHRYDKRGRTYAQGYHVNYQGTDWNKSCIEFANAEKLNDV